MSAKTTEQLYKDMLHQYYGDDSKGTVRGNRPVMKEDTVWYPGEPVEERFEKLPWTSVTERLYEDMAKQLTESQQAMKYFRAEAAIHKEISERLAARVGELFLENESRKYFKRLANWVVSFFRVLAEGSER